MITDQLFFRRFDWKDARIKEVPLFKTYVPCTRAYCMIDGKEEAVRLAPSPLPATIIFVHGVNSEGEWYNDAEEAICAGLNDRLGRHSHESALQRTFYEPYDQKSPLKNPRPRFDPSLDPEQDPYVNPKSPVIRFYWGYKARQGDHRRPSAKDLEHPARLHRQFPVALDEDDSWGGGPFQNGTNSLHAMWTRSGFSRQAAKVLDLQQVNPISDRFLTDGPPRTYFVHAARRLARLIALIREKSPDETLNIVSHSQGTMVASLAMLMLAEDDIRGPETLFLCNSPYSLNAPDSVEAVQYGNNVVPSRNARFNNLARIARYLHASLDGALPDATRTRICLSNRSCKPYLSRAQYGNLYIYCNPHDRVMGAKVLQSLGWRGVSPAEAGQLASDNLRQRCFAENIEVPRGHYRYTMSAQAFGITKDDDGHETGQVRRDFFYPTSERAVAGTLPLYEAPDAAVASIDILADTVPWYADAALRAEIEKHWPALQGWDGRLKNFDAGKEKLDPDNTGADARDQAAWEQVYDGQTTRLGDSPRDVYERRHPIYKSTAQSVTELLAKEHNLTDHSTLLRDAYCVRGVLAWDLALGRNQCYTDAGFWRYLKMLADWKLSDPYFLDNDSGDQPDPGPLPSTLDAELAWPQNSAPVYYGWEEEAPCNARFA